MDWLWWALGALVLVGLIAVMLTPKVVSYGERIIIEAPVAKIYDNVRFQEDLMRWSAWPSTTKSTCEAIGPDGEIGAQTVFFAKGKRFGHQELTALEQKQFVTFRLFGAGPPQKPELTFRFRAVDPQKTEVLLDFRNEIPRPFNVLLRLFGIVRWTRRMHLKDLDGLKRYSEPPHETYIGEPATPRARQNAA